MINSLDFFRWLSLYIRASAIQNLTCLHKLPRKYRLRLVHVSRTLGLHCKHCIQLSLDLAVAKSSSQTRQDHSLSQSLLSRGRGRMVDNLGILVPFTVVLLNVLFPFAVILQPAVVIIWCGKTYEDQLGRHTLSHKQC